MVCTCSPPLQERRQMGENRRGEFKIKLDKSQLWNNFYAVVGCTSVYMPISSININFKGPFRDNFYTLRIKNVNFQGWHPWAGSEGWNIVWWDLNLISTTCFFISTTCLFTFFYEIKFLLSSILKFTSIRRWRSPLCRQGWTRGRAFPRKGEIYFFIFFLQQRFCCFIFLGVKSGANPSVCFYSALFQNPMSHITHLNVSSQISHKNVSSNKTPKRTSDHMLRQRSTPTITLATSPMAERRSPKNIMT